MLADFRNQVCQAVNLGTKVTDKEAAFTLLQKSNQSREQKKDEAQITNSF